MQVHKLTSTDAFIVFDLGDAPAVGIVRQAPKVLRDGAELLARSTTYVAASFGLAVGGGSAGINATPDDRDAAVAAFLEEVAELVASGRWLPGPGLGIRPDDLSSLGRAEARGLAFDQTTAGETAVAAALHLKPLGLTDATAIERGLIEVRWPARMQHLANGPLSRLLVPGSELWLDGGHNPAGGQAIAQTLAEMEERSPKPVGLVLGMMGQKDAPAFLEHFSGLVRRIATVPIPGAPEAAHEPAALAAIAASAGFTAEPAADVEDAIRRLQSAQGGPLRILICGSLYLAGHVLALQEGVQAQAN